MLNQCNFIGRIGRDPESRFTASGKQVVNFSLAVSEKRGQDETTEWVNVICWEKTAKFVADYMKKGQLCFVSGRMATRQWDDKEGNKRYSTEIIANIVQNLSPRSSEGGKTYDAPPNNGEDTPF